MLYDHSKVEYTFSYTTVNQTFACIKIRQNTSLMTFNVMLLALIYLRDRFALNKLNTHYQPSPLSSSLSLGGLKAKLPFLQCSPPILTPIPPPNSPLPSPFSVPLAFSSKKTVMYTYIDRPKWFDQI